MKNKSGFDKFINPKSNAKKKEEFRTEKRKAKADLRSYGDEMRHEKIRKDRGDDLYDTGKKYFGRKEDDGEREQNGRPSQGRGTRKPASGNYNASEKKDFPAGNKSKYKRNKQVEDKSVHKRNSDNNITFQKKDFPSDSKAKYNKEKYAGRGRRDSPAADKHDASHKERFSADKSGRFRDSSTPYGKDKTWNKNNFSSDRKRTSRADDYSVDKNEKATFRKNKFSGDRSSNSRDIDSAKSNKPGFRRESPGFDRKPNSFQKGSSYYAKQDTKRNTEPEQMPLNKYIAHSGISGRREAAELVKQGLVRVNGDIVYEPGFKVTAQDNVLLKDKKLTLQERLVYVLMNKPKDHITTTEDDKGRKTVTDLVKNNVEERIYPVGRLDRNTTGVLLLTNDGDLAQRLMHPSFGVKKIYEVTLDKALNKTDAEKILSGIELEDGIAKADSIGYADAKDKKVVGIELHNGKNHIVKRIFYHLGYTVTKLDRVMFANLTKKNVERGKWRFLNEKEIRLLKSMKQGGRLAGN